MIIKIGIELKKIFKEKIIIGSNEFYKLFDALGNSINNGKKFNEKIWRNIA